MSHRADSAAVAITTTDLVSKSVAVESQVGDKLTTYVLFRCSFSIISLCTYLSITAVIQVGGTTVRVGGMAKGSGMIHPNMATMLGVCP